MYSKPLYPNTMQPGQILYLDALHKIPVGEYLDRSLSQGCFGHPVLVTSVDKKAWTASILICTSFNGTNLADKFPDQRRRSEYLPIGPSPPHPDSGAVVSLANGDRLRSNTYVNFTRGYTVGQGALRHLFNKSKEYFLTSSAWAVVYYHAPEDIKKSMATFCGRNMAARNDPEQSLLVNPIPIWDHTKHIWTTAQPERLGPYIRQHLRLSPPEPSTAAKLRRDSVLNTETASPVLLCSPSPTPPYTTSHTNNSEKLQFLTSLMASCLSPIH